MKENRLPVSYVLQMSPCSTDLSRLWKYSSQSKHGRKHNCLPWNSQQAQQYRGAAGGWQVSTVCGNSHYNFKWGALCYVAGLLLSYMQISPRNHSLIMEIKPKHIYSPARHYHSSRLNICFLGCHHISGEPCATCSISGQKWLQGSGNGGYFFFASRFSVRVWWHISLQLQLSLHRVQARKLYSKNDWLVALSRKLSGVFSGRVNFYKN